jgi:urease accessory protein
MYRRALLTGLLLLLYSTAAYAHTGVGITSGFAHGLAHPIGGMDHVLAMVAVGLFAAHLGGLALWTVPLSFVTMMVAGGAAGMGGMELPFVEIGIGLSVVILGATVGFRLRLPTVAAMALVGLFAIFHGHAHGAEMPETASGFEYALGFVLATAGLHGCGIGLGLVPGRMGEVTGSRISRAAGSAMALAGFAIRRPGAGIDAQPHISAWVASCQVPAARRRLVSPAGAQPAGLLAYRLFVSSQSGDADVSGRPAGHRGQAIISITSSAPNTVRSPQLSHL